MAVSGRKQPRPVLLSSNEDLPFCSPCGKGGSEFKAHGFCSNCKEHLCEACYTSHLRLKLFENHVLLDKSLMPREIPPSDDMCPKHPMQQLEYYCKNHDKLECSRCVTIHHRACENVSYIEDICDDIEEMDEFKTMNRSLVGIEHEAMQSQAHITTNLTGIQSNADQTKEIIRRFLKNRNEQLKRMEETLCTEADDLGDIDKLKLEHVSAECNTLISNVRAVIRDLDVSRRTQQKMRMFILMKNTQRILTEWQKQIADIASHNKIHQYKFEPEKQLESMIEEGRELGRLVLEGDTDKIPDPRIAETVKASLENQVEDKTKRFRNPFRRKVTQSKRPRNTTQDIPVTTPQNATVYTPKDILAVKADAINVETQTDSTSCKITGSASIDDNTMVLVDASNNSIKLVDLNKKKVQDCLIMNREPFNITRINEHTLAVTFPNCVFIQLVKVSKSSTLALGPKIPVDRHCNGIGYIDTGNGRLVVSFIHPHKVKVMDMSGTILNDLSLDTSGRPRFGLPHFITTNNDGGTVIVSNLGTNTVTGLTLDGAVKFEYWDDELMIPKGVALGDGGEIYVCGWKSDNIHVISSEGRKSKILLNKEDGINKPRSITYVDNKLFVGSEKNNNVVVYRIKYQ